MPTIGGEFAVPRHPLATWEDDDCSHPQLVWWAQLDGRFLVEVVRSAGGASHARLRLFDHDQDDLPLSDQAVELADDATHGPAVEDVAAWQATAIAVVDSLGGPARRRRRTLRQAERRADLPARND